MPPIPKRARQLKIARKIKAQKLEMKKKWNYKGTMCSSWNSQSIRESLQNGLEKIRSQRCNSKNILHEIQEKPFGKDQASYLFRQIFEKW